MKDKKILLGVTGSIAAYKTAILARLFIKAGAEVRVLMTPAACEFITPLTLSTLSKNPVNIDFSTKNTGEWNNHVELGRWADSMIIAPATANTIAKFSSGLCDNLLCAVYFSAKCPVFIAPAMDLDMFQHGSTQENLSKLQGYNNKIIPPDHGELASGLIGEGRMAEPEVIFEVVKNSIARGRTSKKKSGLANKKVIVTAGPTYESIDPVRFIGNYSSGKMGFAIAKEFADKDAEVVLISGPTSLQIDHPNIKRIDIESASEMREATLKYFQTTDIAVFAAAVADYAPENRTANKIKKANGSLTLDLKATKDILKEIGKLKNPKQFVMGFALETDNELLNAQKKLKNKNLDLIALNSLNNKGAGFQHDTNQITLIDKYNKVINFELKSKAEVAKDIVLKIDEMLTS